MARVMLGMSLLCVLMSCGKDGAPAAMCGEDGAPAAMCGEDGAPAETCEQLAARWQGIVAELANACDGRGGCEAVGGPMDGSGATCNCAPAPGGCWQVVSRASYRASDAPALEDEFRARCDQPATCDCAIPEYECIDGRCVETRAFDCLGPPP